MFHGGTNFGFTSGANFDKSYQPTVTSYDYDAPLSESGDTTAKFEAFREVIAKYRELPETPMPAPIRKANFGRLEVTGQALLFDQLSRLSEPVRRPTPEPDGGARPEFGPDPLPHARFRAARGGAADHSRGPRPCDRLSERRASGDRSPQRRRAGFPEAGHPRRAARRSRSWSRTWAISITART